MNTQVLPAVREDGALPAEALSMMEVIGRAAADPKTDVDKLERLLSIYERLTAQKVEQEFNASMSAAQSEMRPVSQDASNPQTRSKYASYNALDHALRPIYTKHGFALSFDTADGAADGNIRVVCKVSHRAGHSERPHLDMPADGKGAKGGDVMTKTHATMSAVSYAKRGLLKMIFNIAEGESDDDGNAAGDTNAKITEDQVATIRGMIERTGTDLEKFCAYLKVDALPNLKVKDFPRAIQALNLKERKKS